MIVVTQENPGGRSRRYGRATSRRNARSPEFRSGISRVGELLGQLADEPLGRDPDCLVRARLAGARPDDLVDRRIGVQHGDELGNAIVRVGHVGVGPDDDLTLGLLRPDPAHRPGAAVAREVHDPHPREVRFRGPEPFQRGVGRGVVHGDQLVRQPAGVHDPADALDLAQDVILLVEAREHDRHVRLAAVRRRPAVLRFQLGRRFRRVLRAGRCTCAWTAVRLAAASCGRRVVRRASYACRLAALRWARTGDGGG